MVRYLLTLLLFPLLQRFVPALLSALFRNIQARANAGPRPDPQGTTEYSTEFDHYTGHVTGKVKRVVDGDSLFVEHHDKQVRLWGVQAPEKHDPGYNAATQMLRQLALDEMLEVNIVGVDKFGRTLARCFFRDGRELNHELIKSGVMREYTRFTKGYYANRR